MEGVTAIAMVEAFSTNCPRKNWSCRQFTHKKGDIFREQVAFNDRQGLVSLNYDMATGNGRRFSVTFNKAVASWGDYTNAIAKGLQTILSALEAGGLPFVAPIEPSDIIVRTEWGGIGGVCHVEYEPRTAPVENDIF